MKKNILVITLIFFLVNCGFTPIYLKNTGLSFSIEQVNYKGDRGITSLAISESMIVETNVDGGSLFQNIKVGSNKAISMFTMLENMSHSIRTAAQAVHAMEAPTNAEIEIPFLIKNSLQGDAQLHKIYEKLGVRTEFYKDKIIITKCKLSKSAIHLNLSDLFLYMYAIYFGLLCLLDNNQIFF